MKKATAVIASAAFMLTACSSESAPDLTEGEIVQSCDEKIKELTGAALLIHGTSEIGYPHPRKEETEWVLESTAGYLDGVMDTQVKFVCRIDKEGTHVTLGKKKTRFFNSTE